MHDCFYSEVNEKETLLNFNWWSVDAPPDDGHGETMY